MIFLIFFLFNLGQLGRISFFNQTINFYLYEIGMSILLFFYFLKLKFTPLKKILNHKKLIFWGWLYFFLSFFIKIFDYSLFENIISFLYLLRLFFYFTFFTYLYFYYQINKKNDLILGFLMFSVLTIIFSFTQFFLYPNLRNLAYLGWDVHYNRVFGVFFDTSLAASIYGLIFIFWLIILNYNKTEFFKFFLMNNLIKNLSSFFICHSITKNNIIKNKKISKKKACFEKSQRNYNDKIIINKNILIIFLLVLLFILLYFTYSRFVIFSFFLTLFLFFLKKSLIKYFFLCSFFLIFLLIFFPQRSGVGVNLDRFFSIESRIKENILGIKMGLKNPLFGIGYNRIRFFREKNNLVWYNEFNINHGASSFQSTYVTLFVTTGIIGIFFFTRGLFYLISYNKKFFYLIFFVFIASLADNLLLHPFVIFILGIAKTIFDKKL